MDGISLTSLVTLLAVGVGAYMLFAMYSGPQVDPREPPAAQTKIPYIGHVIGLIRSKFNYYVNLSHETLHPILTVVLPGTKMYVVNSLDLIQAIQKQPKTLAFPPIEAKFANTICGVSPEAHKILLANANGDEGDWGLSMESYAAMRAALAPGVGLDKMNRVMIQNIAGSLDGLIPAGSGSVNINLSHWLRDIVTLATTNAVYGPQNPFKDREVQDSFWQFESQMMSILVGILPSIFASKGLAARARVSKAFEDYLKTGGYKEGSLLMNNRYETSVKNGVPIEDIARYEVGGAIAILVNTAPAAFWLVLFLYSDAELLDEIRKEIWAVVNTSGEANGEANVLYRLDITNLKANCPLLLSSYQESLRHRSMGTSVREVVKDTVLDGKWLLKKDCMIQMPSRIIHMDPRIWGSDVEEFNPRRFMKDQKRVKSTAFRAFGGGTTLCPGRHFATNEVLAVVSMFVMRFDITPVVGKWSLPTTDKTNVAAVLMEPDDDIEVRVEARKGFDGRWAFGLRDSEEIFAIVDEDLTDHRD